MHVQSPGVHVRIVAPNHQHQLITIDHLIWISKEIKQNTVLQYCKLYFLPIPE